MLWNKLASVTGGSVVDFVGGRVQAFIGTSSNQTISLTGLTGGIATAPALGDLVVVCYGIGSSGAGTISVVTAGYTSLYSGYANDTYDSNLIIRYKQLTTAETSVVVSGTVSTANAGIVGIYVFRNTATALATPVANIITNSRLPVFPAVTPTIDGSVIMVVGVGGASSGATYTANGGINGFLTLNSIDTNDIQIGIGWYSWVTGAFTPPAFTGATNTSDSAIAVTIIIPPA